MFLFQKGFAFILQLKTISIYTERAETLAVIQFAYNSCKLALLYVSVIKVHACVHRKNML